MVVRLFGKLLPLLLLLAMVLIFTLLEGAFVLPPQLANIENNADQHAGVGAYIISLDRSVERYKRVLPRVEKLGLPIKHIHAVDGAALSFLEIEQKVDINSFIHFMGVAPRRGTIGCSLSHIKTWEDFLRSPYEYALIVEDDIDFDPQLLANTITELTKNPQWWDMVMFEVHHGGTPMMVHFLPHVNRDLSVYLTMVAHSGAYIINRSTAHKFLAKSLPIKMPIDHYFTRAWELDVRVMGVEPRIVHQTFGDSEISATKKVNLQNDKISSWGVNLRRFTYQMKTHVMYFGYNLLLYLQEG